MTNVIFTLEQYAAAVERLKKKLAACQAAKETVERIVAGAPRSTFGKFTASLEDVAPDFVPLEAGVAHQNSSRDGSNDRAKS